MLPLAPLASITVTVVDSDPQSLQDLVQAAQTCQFLSQSTTQPLQALQLLEQCPTPVVVLALSRLGAGGVHLIREIRQRWPEIATIVVSGDPDRNAAVDCLNLGVQRFFLKPVRLSEFRQGLKSLVQAQQQQQAELRRQQHLKQLVRRQTRLSRSTFLSAIDSLIRALEARDAYTSGHSLRVRQYSLQLAVMLGRSHQERQQISLAAKLHDIGKVGVPEAILNKPGRLSRDEFRQVQEHPAISERILTPIIRDPAILAGIRSHHERFDGQGYPDGLAGRNIALPARIVAIADCFDALTSSRAYRDPLPVPEALHLIRQGAGSQFDPEFIPVFLQIVKQHVAQKQQTPALGECEAPAFWSLPANGNGHAGAAPGLPVQEVVPKNQQPAGPVIEVGAAGCCLISSEPEDVQVVGSVIND